MIITIKRQFISGQYKITQVGKLYLVQHITQADKLYSVQRDGSLVRLFSSTPPRKGDPLGVTAAAITIPYTVSFLNNPLGGPVMVLIGMATTLFFVITSLFAVFGQDNAYPLLIQQLDRILLLSERFLSYEREVVSLIGANLSSFSPETLHGFYLSLQQLVAISESLFSIINDFLISHHVEHLPGPLVDRINQNFENLRLEGNGIMMLVREIENRLDIAESERIPTFWFEDYNF